MRCVQIDSTGTVVDVVPQPADASTCAVVLASPGELQGNPLLQLTPSEASAIASAVALLWAVAWGFRQVIRLLSTPDRSIED